MRDEKYHEYTSPDDETDVPLSDEELLYLNAGYVHYDDDIQSDTDWGYNLEMETGIKV